MKIETIEQRFETCVREAGGMLRPSEPTSYSPVEVNGAYSRVPPLLEPPRILIDSPRMYFGVHPWPPEDSQRLTDTEFLAFPRYPLGGNMSLMQAIDQGLAKVANGLTQEHGGTRRRLEFRPKSLTAGSECTLPYFLLNASPLLATPFPEVSTSLKPYESMAQGAAKNLGMYGLNHDRYIPCIPSDLDRAVTAISDALEGELKKANIPCAVAQDGDARVLRVTDEASISRIWAPPTIEALVFPRQPKRNPRMPVSVYPGLEIAEWRISVARERPVGNPVLEPINITTGVTDNIGRWLNIGHVEFINAVGTQNDHRTGMVNALQNCGITWDRDGWYAREYREYSEGEKVDSIPENFPNDPDRAYCTLLRMCAELMAQVYVREYRFEKSAPPVEPLARAIRASTDRLVDIVTDTGSVAPHKVAEGLQQLIIFHLNQPHAWSSLANALNLGRIFPRAEPLWNALGQQPILENDHKLCTDAYISGTVRMPEIWVETSSRTYRVGDPTAIHRVIDYAEGVVGMRFPKSLSLLGKLAWLYEPLR